MDQVTISPSVAILYNSLQRKPKKEMAYEEWLEKGKGETSQKQFAHAIVSFGNALPSREKCEIVIKILFIKVYILRIALFND